MNFKNAIKSAAALAIGLAAAPAAQAADYSANVLVQLNLTRVTGGTLGADVLAAFSNSVFGTPVANASGAAWASNDPYFYTVPAAYSENSAGVTGSAYSWGGQAYSELLTNGLVQLANNTTGDVTFTFDWAITGNASASGADYADAFGSADIFDANGAMSDIYSSMSVTSNGTQTASLNDSGTFTVTLAGNSTDDLNVQVNTNGNAVMAVPEPETYALMLTALGLLGVVARRRGT